MQKLVLNAKDRSYSIYCGSGIYLKAAELFDINNCKVCIVSDSTVAPLYSESLKKTFCSAEVYDFVFPAGETSKTLETCIKAYDFLAQKNFTKTDTLIALGGGVCGDLTGFIAATYLRGIKYYSIPTTLLAQVDSSIGGKCGVDIKYGKNLVGSFYQPYGVIADTIFLKTLNETTFNGGMAEVIKYGFIYDKNIYDRCIEGYDKYIEEIIYRCIDIKREIVETDEHDNGIRMILNFGHTIGHAIEKLGNYREYSHGQAIACGMAYAAKLSECAGTAKKGIYEAVVEALTKLNLPVKADYTQNQITPVILGDKKLRGGYLNFVLLSAIGSAVIYKVSQNDVADFIKQAF